MLYLGERHRRESGALALASILLIPLCISNMVPLRGIRKDCFMGDYQSVTFLQTLVKRGVSFHGCDDDKAAIAY